MRVNERGREGEKKREEREIEIEIEMVWSCYQCSSLSIKVSQRSERRAFSGLSWKAHSSYTHMNS